MPVYEYREGDRIVERVLPIDRRDAFPNRLTVPRRINVCPRGEPEHGSQLLQGWKECEEDGGTDSTRQLARQMGLTREQVKQACLAPDRVMERPLGPGSEII